jgi:nitrate/nitrite transport system substrate-binding protein
MDKDSLIKDALDPATQFHSCGCGLPNPHSVQDHIDGRVATKPVFSRPLSGGVDYALERVIENSIVRAILPQESTRRAFLKTVGSGTAAALVASLFPLKQAVALAAEAPSGAAGAIELKTPKIGFIPITCATPLIMADPMGFYKKHGIEPVLEKVAGWAMIRDKSITGETDATHMLTPMPIACTLGLGSQAVPYVMPAIENINGQAITLHIKHKDKLDPKDWKGFTFCVPFDYSMHNLLLRYVVAESGLDPDKDIKIRVVPPPEMVANLTAGNVDGYLAPDPFNQRAVFQNVGFIWKLTKDIWPGHPCCAFATTKAFATKNPNSFRAMLKAIIEATAYVKKPENRAEVAKAIAPKNYLNQPPIVVEQVLTGKYPDGLGNMKDVPDRIDFDPFPYSSMAIWIMTQLKRWGYLKQDADYKKVADEVFLAADCKKAMQEMGLVPPEKTSVTYSIMGKVFDPEKAEEYANSFAIKKA